MNGFQPERIRAVVFDWAGTLVDHGSLAPTRVFIEGFRSFGVEITMEEAREPMGKPKREHIRALLDMPAVRERWRLAHGRFPNETDIDTIFADFIPRQIAVIEQYSAPIPGVIEMVAALRERGIRIGSSTGYTRAMMDALIPAARGHGLEIETIITPDDVRAGRPAPWMCYLNAMQMDVYPMASMVKVGDTPVDIQEGRNAGMWTVGVALTGNAAGLSLDDLNALTSEERALMRECAAEQLKMAHVIIDSAADLLPTLDEIERRIANGEHP